jgi:hypothetical protein
MSETFEDELHENPEHITLASITHSDPENI